MKTVTINRKIIEIYDSIEELPISRFHKFNKYLLVDSGIGSDINDINSKISRVQAYINTSDTQKANLELENLRQALFLIAQETNVKHLSFMALIKSVDGEEVTDTSDENIKHLQDTIFKTVSLGYFNTLFEAVKKKIDQELSLYFPSLFDDVALKEYYDKLKSRALLQLDTILKDEDNETKIESIDIFLLTMAKPKSFSGKASAEILYDKQFDEMCLYLTHELNLDISKTTVFKFYNSFEYIKKQNKNGR